MTRTLQPAVSVLVATRNRAADLRRFLESCDTARAAAGQGSELIIVDNGSTDETPAVLAQWAARGCMALHVAAPGKSRALNHALQHARAPLLAFADDDERVTPGWLHHIFAFFTEHPEYDAGVGRVLPPTEVTDADILERVARYRTIAFFDHGDVVREERMLHGANMVLRRRVFDVVGGFNEALGPGAVGGCEDADLGDRVVRAGLRIGYMPAVVVHHSIDTARLTPGWFRQFELVTARSRFAMNPARARRHALPRLLEATAAFVWWSVARRPVRREHARGRMIRHAEVLRLAYRTSIDRRPRGAA